MSADLQGRANSKSQVDGVSDMAPICRLCGSMGGGLRKLTMAFVCLSVWKKAVPQLPPWCQTLQFLPLCHWCLASCYPRDAQAQRECVCVSSHAGSFQGNSWDPRSFFHWLSIPMDFSSQKLWRLIFLVPEAWAGGSESGAESPHSQNIPPKFLFTTHGCDTIPFHVLPLLPVWMDVVS